MKKLIDIRTGQAMFYAARTVKAGKLPKYLVDPSTIEKKKEPVVQEVPKAKPVEEIIEPVDEEITDPTPDEMKAFLKEKGIKFSPNIGVEKLTEKYEAAQ